METKDYKDFMKGTTTAGIICSDGVVMGADSRATMDTFIASSEAKKVYKIDSNVAMTVAGAVGDAQALIRIMKAQNEIYKMNEGKSLSPKSATSLLSIILQENKMVPFYVQLMVGGVDGENSRLYTIDALGGYTEESRIASTGSGSPVALGYLENIYRKTITTKEAIKDIAKALSIAMKRDSATGDTITIAVITEGSYKEYSGKELEKILSAK
ncbi:MAG: proteasome subunit beta [Candidatus Marsarchaeota archaeon]|jgi:proteasome beta subunit|nr:proteasome subunit beta [Candidatus Marsarchaeota archaeon]